MSERGKRRADESGWNEAPWRRLVLVCETCLRRSGRKGLRSDLKAGFKARTGKDRVKVVETGCLGVCPKRGVAIATSPGVPGGAVFVLGAEVPAEVAVAALVREA